MGLGDWEPDWFDTVIVVRCKNCKHKVTKDGDNFYCDTMWIDFDIEDGLTDNDYCSSGEVDK